uniref:Putative secreted peptide n=1 Tax=Anopheles braziliensis TaxID=58242 RepID=A0A2M3ZTE2_9DIPT
MVPCRWLVLMVTPSHRFVQRIAADGRGCQLGRQHTGRFTVRILLLQERTLYHRSGRPRMAFIGCRPTTTTTAGR